MHRLWMIFAQAVTISVALLFVVSTLKPEWVSDRPARHGGIQKRLARRHPADDALHLRPSFHLQAVWAIIPEAFNLEQSVEMALQFNSFHDRFPRKLALIQRASVRYRWQILRCIACG